MVFSINCETGSLLRQGKGTSKWVSQGSPWNYLKSIIFNVLRCPSEPFHSMFLEWWNTKKSLYHIWHHFFLSTITCKIKQAGSFCHFSFFTIQKAIVSCIFLQFSHQVDMKIIANTFCDILYILLKFSFSEKATKICAICLKFLTFTFCGLLRKSEL